MAGEPGPRRRLTKSHDRRIAGVAGGLAEYFDVDPTLVRVLWVVALFIGPFGGGALLAYIVLWIIVPGPEGEAPARTSGGGTDPTLVLGIIIVALGVLLLLRTSWVWTSWLGWTVASVFWPLALVALGAYVIYRAKQA